MRQDAGSLASALPPRDWSDWYAWVGPESGSLKEIRTRLKEFGFPRAAMHAQAYWVQGKSMGKERDPEVDTIAQAPVPAPDGRYAGGDPEPAPGATPQAEPVVIPPQAEPVVISAQAAPEDQAKAGGGPEQPAPTGTWRAAGAGRLLRPLKRTLILAGVAQAVVTVVSFAPYLLLVELGRRLLDGAPADRLWHTAKLGSDARTQ